MFCKFYYLYLSNQHKVVLYNIFYLKSQYLIQYIIVWFTIFIIKYSGHKNFQKYIVVDDLVLLHSDHSLTKIL